MKTGGYCTGEVRAHFKGVGEPARARWCEHIHSLKQLAQQWIRQDSHPGGKAALPRRSHDVNKVALLHFWFVHQSPGKYLFACSASLQRNQMLSSVPQPTDHTLPADSKRKSSYPCSLESSWLRARPPFQMKCLDKAAFTLNSRVCWGRTHRDRKCVWFYSNSGG